MFSISTTSEKLYYITCNPLIDIYHIGEITNSVLKCGQPFILYSNDIDSICSLIFCRYNLEDSDENISWEFGWSVYTDEVEIDSIITVVNSFDFINISKIKHPINDEWAIPFNEVLFSGLPRGSEKDYLLNKATASVIEGRRFDKETMINGGWV